MTDERLRELYHPILMRTGADDRLKCPDPDRLRELAERAGAEAARLETLDHVMACDACRKEYELLIAIAGLGPARRLTAPLLALAATLALMVAAGALWKVSRPSVEPIRDARETLRLVAPNGEPSPASGVRFVWTAVPDAFRYDAEILGPDGSRIYTGSGPDTVLLLPDSVSLAAGVTYHWWVRAELSRGGELRSELTEFRLRP